MSEIITISISGQPVAKGRPQFVKATGIAITPKKTRAWEKDARQVARMQMSGRKPIEGPVQLTVIAFFVPSMSWPTWKQEAALNGQVVHTAKPDLDNLVKAAKDAMNGIVWLDDAQVASSSERKCYGDRPGVVITAQKLDLLPSQVKTRAAFTQFINSQKDK